MADTNTAGIDIAGILNRAQLAAWLHVSEETIERWERDGLPVIAHGRKVRLYKVEKVLAWMEGKAA